MCKTNEYVCEICECTIPILTDEKGYEYIPAVDVNGTFGCIKCYNECMDVSPFADAT